MLELDFNRYLIKLSFGVSGDSIEVVVDLSDDLGEVRDGLKTIFKFCLIDVNEI